MAPLGALAHSLGTAALVKVGVCVVLKLRAQLMTPLALVSTSRLNQGAEPGKDLLWKVL